MLPASALVARGGAGSGSGGGGGLCGLLAARPASEQECLMALCRGQRFVHLRQTRFGTWRRKRCHVHLSDDLRSLEYARLKGEQRTKTLSIPTQDIINATCTTMFGVASPPDDVKGKRVLSLILRKRPQGAASSPDDGDAPNYNARPKSHVMHLIPNTGCVQIGEVVELAEQNEDGEVEERLGVVLMYDRKDPTLVHVRIDGSEEVVLINSEALTRPDDDEPTRALQENAHKAVWNWYQGVCLLKELCAAVGESATNPQLLEAQASYARLNARIKGEARKRWSAEQLICGHVFTRVFVGPQLRSAKIVPRCYIRCSKDLSELLYVPFDILSGNGTLARLCKGLVSVCYLQFFSSLCWGGRFFAFFDCVWG